MSSITIKIVDLHTNGEPFRVVTDAEPKVVFPSGTNLMEKRRIMASHYDHIRKLTMHEPRGHAAMYGGFLTEADPLEEAAHIAVLFLRGVGYGVMCGHGTLALARYAVDNGFVDKREPETRVSLQVPVGLVEAFAEVKNGKTTGEVRFIAPNSYLYARNLQVTYGNRQVTFDIAYGGVFYAIVTANDIGVDLDNDGEQKMGRIGIELKHVIAKEFPITITDPLAPPEYQFLDGIIMCCERNPKRLDRPLKHVTVIAAQVDRSPCGSGTTARLTAMSVKGIVDKNQTVSFVNPLVGKRSVFCAKVLKTGLNKVPMGTNFIGIENGVQCEIRGQAFYTGESTFRVEENDIFPSGLVVRL